MKDSTKTAIAGVIFAILGLFSTYYVKVKDQKFMNIYKHFKHLFK